MNDTLAAPRLTPEWAAIAGATPHGPVKSTLEVYLLGEAKGAVLAVGQVNDLQ